MGYSSSNIGAAEAIILLAICLVVLVAWLMAINLFINAAREKGYHRKSSGLLWFIGIVTTPIMVGLYAAALPDKRGREHSIDAGSNGYGYGASAGSSSYAAGANTNSAGYPTASTTNSNASAPAQSVYPYKYESPTANVGESTQALSSPQPFTVPQPSNATATMTYPVISGNPAPNAQPEFVGGAQIPPTQTEPQRIQ